MCSNVLLCLKIIDQKVLSSHLSWLELFTKSTVHVHVCTSPPARSDGLNSPHATSVLQEIREVRQRFDNRLVEVDSGRKEEYEFKLSQALADMRAQNEEQIRLYKDNMDGTYRTKVPTRTCSLRHGSCGKCLLDLLTELTDKRRFRNPSDSCHSTFFRRHSSSEKNPQKQTSDSLRPS